MDGKGRMLQMIQASSQKSNSKNKPKKISILYHSGVSAIFDQKMSKDESRIQMPMVWRQPSKQERLRTSVRAHYTNPI
jgi:hypothetical protein